MRGSGRRRHRGRPRSRQARRRRGRRAPGRRASATERWRRLRRRDRRRVESPAFAIAEPEPAQRIGSVPADPPDQRPAHRLAGPEPVRPLGGLGDGRHARRCPRARRSVRAVGGPVDRVLGGRRPDQRRDRRDRAVDVGGQPAQRGQPFGDRLAAAPAAAAGCRAGPTTAETANTGTDAEPVRRPAARSGRRGTGGIRVGQPVGLVEHDDGAVRRAGGTCAGTARG